MHLKFSNSLCQFHLIISKYILKYVQSCFMKAVFVACLALQLHLTSHRDTRLESANGSSVGGRTLGDFCLSF